MKIELYRKLCKDVRRYIYDNPGATKEDVHAAFENCDGVLNTLHCRRLIRFEDGGDCGARGPVMDGHVQDSIDGWNRPIRVPHEKPPIKKVT